MTCEQFYDRVIEEQRRLTEQALYFDDYRQVKALAALYELQDYLAGRIAEEIESSKSDDIC